MDATAWENFIQGTFLVMAIANAVSAAFFWRMRATFVSQKDIADLENKLDKRLREVADIVSKKADENDLVSHDVRLRAVENIQAATSAEIRGVRDIMVRVEHQVQLLVNYRLEESRP